MLPSTRCRSVAQTPHAATSTSTSVAPSGGSGRRSRRRAPAPYQTALSVGPGGGRQLCAASRAGAVDHQRRVGSGLAHRPARSPHLGDDRGDGQRDPGDALPARGRSQPRRPRHAREGPRGPGEAGRGVAAGARRRRDPPARQLQRPDDRRDPRLRERSGRPRALPLRPRDRHGLALRAGQVRQLLNPVGAPPILERPIPSSGETIPVIGLGTWQTFDVGAGAAERAQLGTVLQRFVELGGRLIDSSQMYGAAESVVGELAADLAITDKLFLATKVWTSGRAAGVAQMEESLRRLRTRRLDLLQVHNLLDWRTHLGTLRDWQQAGRLRYVGVTHYTSSGYDELERVLRSERLDFVQVNYSLDEREAERRILPLARDRGVAVIVNRP